ncbi:chemotaxis protein CheW [Jannaschia sp. S6380]|uniref:chemotaxis protein CheW n=1 Tax=Jannaschia sp. S6380 TaxID=2926408 RepID=UPI001FF31DBB|nr:chemotaxis protein CheW [Jannaschia sp. S6380]MCK0166604.1 chemotaxis protein CheW [Jannaschia sp. S6380]
MTAEEHEWNAAPPGDATPPSGPARTELLTFRCGGQCYALDIASVREIRGWSRPTPLPHTPKFMLGMVNLRGTVLPVTDLALRLGHPAMPDDARNVIIVVQQARRLHGLLVEAVTDIVRPAPDQLQDMPQVGAARDGVAPDRMFLSETGILQILALERVLPALHAPDAEAIP